MANILIRNIDDRVIVLLKQRAKRNGRSLNDEIKAIFEELVKDEPIEFES